MPTRTIYFRIAKPISVVVAYVLTPILVPATALLVQRIQYLVIAADHGVYTNPNLIAFLIPIVAISILGGKAPGWCAVILSALVSIWLLLPPIHYLAIEKWADWVALGFMVVGGSLLVYGIDIVRRAAQAQIQVTQDLSLLHERAQRIASAFQEPLVPHFSGSAPGLEIDYYYQPALDEAQVGGDFLDVFASDRGDTVLVLGDISGKGLSAATQVSAVRSMLRSELFDRSAVELSSSIERVNEVLAAQELLTGFATLFVGIFDKDSSELTYVSCGHEPALLRPQIGGVQELASTGSVLGAFRWRKFDQVTHAFKHGDTLVAYTDGLSEAGPDRGNMLGSAGLRLIVENCGADEPAHSIVTQVIGGARSFANGVLLDDACVLVCRATDTACEASHGELNATQRENLVTRVW